MRFVVPIAVMLTTVCNTEAVVYRVLSGDNTTIFSDGSAAENGRSFSTVISGTPLMPWITSTQHYSGSYSLGIQVPTDNTGNKERFEYEILPASDPNGLHFDNDRYCGFAFKLASPAASFGSSMLFWQAWQGSPWGPPASLKLTADSSAPYTIGLYIRNMATGPDSAVSDQKLWSSSMIQPDVWYSVVIYISPRYTNNNGNIKLWIDGTNYVNTTTNIGYDPALVAGALNGLDIKNGIYQPDANNGHAMFFDQIVVASTYVEAVSLPTYTNTPPSAFPGHISTKQNTSVDYDLWSLVTDAQTPAAKCLFSLGATSNGTVALLPDGHTARFTPATNFVGGATFGYVVSDQGEDRRTYLHYSFEPPDSPADGFAIDSSLNGRDGSLLAIGTGAYTYGVTVPFPGFEADALELTQSGTSGAASVSYLIPPQFDLSASDWTCALWFQRTATTDHDFLFYVGAGNGFGGDGDELQLDCPNGSSSLRLQHYNTNNALDVDISSSTTAVAGQWHHAALVFQRTNANSGVLRAYLDGAQFGPATNVTWSLQQQNPVVFGGHNLTNSGVDRWFDGRLDDIVMFTNALSPSEIAELATRTVANFGGLRATNEVTVSITRYAAPSLSSIAFSNGAWLMTVGGDTGATYVVQAATNLVAPVWTPLATNVSAQPPFVFTDTATGFAARFYRVVVMP